MGRAGKEGRRGEKRGEWRVASRLLGDGRPGSRPHVHAASWERWMRELTTWRTNDEISDDGGACQSYSLTLTLTHTRTRAGHAAMSSTTWAEQRASSRQDWRRISSWHSTSRSLFTSSLCSTSESHTRMHRCTCRALGINFHQVWFYRCQ